MYLTHMQYSCDRLDKICQPTKSKRQLKSDGVRNSRVEKSRSDDVSRLERKLDQLVAHLKGPQQNLASPSSSDASTLIPSPVHVCHRKNHYIVAPNIGLFVTLLTARPLDSSPMRSAQQKPKIIFCVSEDAMRDSFPT